jgi:hypothetical protein
MKNILKSLSVLLIGTSTALSGANASALSMTNSSIPQTPPPNYNRYETDLSKCKTKGFTVYDKVTGNCLPTTGSVPGK